MGDTVKDAAARLRKCLGGDPSPTWASYPLSVKVIAACCEYEYRAFSEMRDKRGEWCNEPYQIRGISEMEMARWMGDFYRMLREGCHAL